MFRFTYRLSLGIAEWLEVRLLIAALTRTRVNEGNR